MLVAACTLISRIVSDSRETAMNLSAPTQVVFIIALIIAIIALLMMVNVITFIPIASFWVMTIAYVVLAIGCMIKGA